MEQGISIAAFVVALASIGIAFWQGSTSKKQLDLAKKQLEMARDTEGRTERALEEIKRVTQETRQLSQDVKNSIDERITKILDNKLAAEQQSQSASSAMSQAFMTKLMESMGSKPPKVD